ACRRMRSPPAERAWFDRLTTSGGGGLPQASFDKLRMSGLRQVQSVLRPTRSRHPELASTPLCSIFVLGSNHHGQAQTPLCLFRLWGRVHALAGAMRRLRGMEYAGG